MFSSHFEGKVIAVLLVLQAVYILSVWVTTKQRCEQRRYTSQLKMTENTTATPPFLECAIRFTVATPAPYVHQLEKQAAEEVLDAQLLRYNERLRGTLLAYKRLKPDQEGVGVFQDEQPDVLFRWTAKCLLYAPEIGQIVRADVNDVQAGHVTLLVAGLFSVVVPGANLPKKARFMPAGFKDDGKRFVDKKGNTVIMVGKEMDVKVVAVSKDGRGVEGTFRF